MTGGNYTYHFIPSWLLKYVAEIHSFLQIKFSLVEIKDIEDHSPNANILLTSVSNNMLFLTIPNIFNTEVFFQDEVYFITSKKTLDLLNKNKRVVLDNVGLVFARTAENTPQRFRYAG